jgi:hypothetical protein
VQISNPDLIVEKKTLEERMDRNPKAPFEGWQIAEAEHVARELGVERFVSSQNQYNLTDRRAELEVLPACEAFGLGPRTPERQRTYRSPASGARPSQRLESAPGRRSRKAGPGCSTPTPRPAA